MMYDVHLQKTSEERGRRIASQWTTDPDAALPVSAVISPSCAPCYMFAVDVFLFIYFFSHSPVSVVISPCCATHYLFIV